MGLKGASLWVVSVALFVTFKWFGGWSGRNLGASRSVCLMLLYPSGCVVDGMDHFQKMSKT